MKIFKLNGKNIPRISIGTSTFIGAGQYLSFPLEKKFQYWKLGEK